MIENSTAIDGNEEIVFELFNDLGSDLLFLIKL